MTIQCNVSMKSMKFESKVVIFDSPDGTGKTNIACALSNALSVPYFRMGSQHDNWRAGKFKEALEFDQTYISSFLKQTRTSVIIDRAYPSEWVYSKAYSRQTNEDVLRQVDEEFARLGTYIVIPLRRDYSKSRDDEVVKKSMLKKLHELYNSFCEWTKCSTIRLYVDDFDDDTSVQLPLLLQCLDFDRLVTGFAMNVTIERPFEQKDVSSIFVSKPDFGKSVEIKRR